MKIKITVGTKEFIATLNESDAAKQLAKMLPLSVIMNEHNGNEKYYNLPETLPGRAIHPGNIQAGDLMIWSGNTLVLFYTAGSTSYSYIRLGRIDDPSGLRESVGKGNVQVKYEVIQEEK